MSRFAWKWETYEDTKELIDMTTHALLGLKAEIIKDSDGQAQSISIVEPQEESQVNLTLIFDIDTGVLVEAKAITGLLNDGNEA